jgi:hypothetical protein
MSKRFTLLVLAALIFVGIGGGASACTVCMGDETSNIAKGANGAIFLMLGVLFATLGSFAAFMVYLAVKGRQPLPPHAELASAARGEGAV